MSKSVELKYQNEAQGFFSVGSLVSSSDLLMLSEVVSPLDRTSLEGPDLPSIQIKS